MAIDLFGEEVKHTTAYTSRGKLRGGYAAPPGTGPGNETCGSCQHHVRVDYHNKGYHKCALCSEQWTHGPGSDIRVRAAACRFWLARIDDDKAP